MSEQDKTNVTDDAFEKWLRDGCATDEIRIAMLERLPNGEYKNQLTFAGLKGWQAASQHYEREIAELKTKVSYLETGIAETYETQVLELTAHVNQLREFIQSHKFSVDEKSFYKDVSFSAIKPHSICYRIPIDSTKSFIFSDIENRRNEILAATAPQSLQAHDNEVIDRCAKLCESTHNGWVTSEAAEAIRALKAKP